MTTPTIILIVSDILIGKSYGEALVASGAEVIVVTDRSELEYYKDIKPTVVVLDSTLPVPFKDTALTTWVPREFKLIALSSFGSSFDIEEAKALGAIGYIVKASTTPREFVDKLFNSITR